MIEIRTSQHNQARQMRVRECAFYETQTEILQSVPMLNMIITFDVRAEVPHYAIDKTPVTNADYAAFIQASGYTPKHSGN
ncbi:MAG: SUMF1/EgtB/PvdO family nonheme iron enzyme, partial [Phycisphaerales bacterium]|nr:SUMF1/EgtB/PvdO family nonheme iron enzyme [Phycisphaerales bacterium]